MGDETIPLSKSYSEKKLNYPVYISVKLDGMPVKYHLKDKKVVNLLSRQGTENISCIPASKILLGALTESAECLLVSEMTHHTDKDFKVVSGHVRRRVENPDLVLNVFDFCLVGQESKGFGERWQHLEKILEKKYRVTQHIAHNKVELDKISEKLMEDRGIEGLVYRSHDDPFVPASRSWGYQKLVIKPTADLQILRYYEALETDTKKPKGMVGGMWCEYKGKEIRVPAGKMKHDERISEWNKHLDSSQRTSKRILEVQYKKDDSYDVLREPTFQHWRPEKSEPSYD